MIALIPVGIFVALAGGLLLWSGTGGSEWNSTHNRAFQRTAHVSAGRQRYNNWASRIMGPLAISIGIVCVVSAVLHWNP